MMWRLLRAELAYHRIHLIFAYCIAIPTLLGTIHWAGGIDRLSDTSTYRMMLVVQLIFWSVLLPLLIAPSVDRRKSKRARLFAQLLVPIGRIGLIFLALPLIFWFSLVLMFWTIYLVDAPGHIELSHVWKTLAFSGFMLVASASVLFYDLNYCIKEKRQRLVLNILGPAVFSLFALLFVFVILPPGSPTSLGFLSRIMLDLGSSMEGAIGLFILGIVVAVIGVVIFAKRRSFVD